MQSGISFSRSRLTLIAAGAAGLLAVACGSSPPALPSGLGSLFSPSSHGSGTSAPAGNAAWSAPVKVDSTGTQGLNAISCASSSFCVATDPAGNAFVYTGTWSSATNIDSTIPSGNDAEDNLQSVSCVSSSFCVVGDSKANVMIYNGSSWSQPQSIDPNTGAGFFSVSCPSATFCMAVDGAANAISFNGTTWSTPAPIDPNSSELSSELTSVSCGSPSFCVALDGADDSITFNGTAWGQPQTLNTSGGTQQPVVPYVSCGSTTLCVGAGSINDTSEYLVTYDGTNWSSPVPAEDTPDEYIAVSCATSATFCMVLEAGGHDVTYDGSTWSHPQQIEPLTEDALPTAVSCVSASDCVMVDSAGNALTSRSS
jgi:uncharacterized Fe-S cluster protein YjdI